MTTGPEELRNRTKAFAVAIVKFYRHLPYRSDAQVLLDCEIVPEPKLSGLLKEGRELSALFTASQSTAKRAVAGGT